jgi:hypothetical protein
MILFGCFQLDILKEDIIDIIMMVLDIFHRNFLGFNKVLMDILVVENTDVLLVVFMVMLRVLGSLDSIVGIKPKEEGQLESSMFGMK